MADVEGFGHKLVEVRVRRLADEREVGARFLPNDAGESFIFAPAAALRVLVLLAVTRSTLLIVFAPGPLLCRTTHEWASRLAAGLRSEFSG